MKKLVSVIIPSYNHAKYIGDCVTSVLNQTYENLEVFVMDDCSTDNSVDVLKKIKDKRLKIFYSKTNNGTVRTINELTKKCTGDYIAIIGSDDIWKKDKIEKQVDYLEKNNDVGAVFCLADIIDEHGKKYVPDGGFNVDIFKSENVSSSKRMRLFFEIGNHLCHSSSLIRKSVVDKIGFYDLTYRQLHDFEYWVRLVNEFNIYVLDDKLLQYRRFKKGKTNLSNNSSKVLVRVANETNSIINWMFNNIKDELFIDGFKDLFVNIKSQTAEELLCEKYFILLKYDIMGVINKQVAFSLIYNYRDKEKLFKIFENKFNYLLDDFYAETGKTYDLFNFDLVEGKDCHTGRIINDCKNHIKNQDNIIKFLKDKTTILEHNIDLLKSSTSWKITKPLRIIKGLIRYEKN